MFSGSFDELRALAKEVRRVNEASEERGLFFDQVNTLWKFESFEAEKLFPSRFQLTKQRNVDTSGFVVKVIIRNETCATFLRKFCRVICNFRDSRNYSVACEMAADWIPNNEVTYYYPVLYSNNTISCDIYLSLVIPKSIRMSAFDGKMLLVFRIAALSISPADYIRVCKEATTVTILNQPPPSTCSLISRRLGLKQIRAETLSKMFGLEPSVRLCLNNASLDMKFEKNNGLTTVQLDDGDSKLVQGIHSSLLKKAAEACEEDKEEVAISKDIIGKLMVLLERFTKADEKSLIDKPEDIVPYLVQLRKIVDSSIVL